MKYRNLITSVLMMTGLFAQSLVGVVTDVNSLESKSGKPFMDKDIPDNLKDQLSFVKSKRTKAYNTSQVFERRFSSYGTLTKDKNGNPVYNMRPFPGENTEVEPLIVEGITLPREVSKNEEAWRINYNKSRDAHFKSMQQFYRENKAYENFYKNHNLIYPQLNASSIGTLEQPKKVKPAGSKDMSGEDLDNKTFSDNEIKNGLNNPELGIQILGYLEDPTPENFLSFKDGVLQEGEYTNLIKQFNESGEEPSVTIVSPETSKKDNDIPEDWKIGAGTNQIAVDDRERETIVDDASDPAQDFVEDEDKISPILSPVTAGTRSETADRDPSQYKKDIDISTIMPELITPESLNELNLKDEKGNEINFQNSSAKKIDNQLNSMYKKIDNINKQLKQTSSSREEKELMKSNAMEIINNLLNALEASKMEAKNVKEKNIKATVSSFLKNKNTSIDKLKKYYNTLF